MIYDKVYCPVTYNFNVVKKWELIYSYNHVVLFY